MRRRITGTVLGGLILALVPFLTAPAQAAVPYHHACATAHKGRASCTALVRSDIAKSAKSLQEKAAAPSGLAPADLQGAYKLPSSDAGSGQTVAIVDAYDAPTAEADLGVYRSQYGLSACTTANGCFKKVDQNGGTSYPATDGGWAQEISLDLDMVSATCPNCKIVLVEADSASFADLGAAVNTAAGLANVVSNSYGGSDASDDDYGSYYNHPGVAMTVSSGDSGYGVEYPASSQYVTAVGGTSLKSASNSRGWDETAWDGAGSGCSDQNPALAGQADADTGCSGRAVADVSAVADPATGVAVYDSTAYQGQSGWMVFGGTSVAAPVIAGVYGLAGNASDVDNNTPYAHPDALFDVTSGSNGSCSTAQLCTARSGWDGPTGLGTPNGTGAF
ncbi:S53 family peptidase [Actinoallomurus acaciae]|uniref:Peptidase S53 domain-containing protein n=1 Tax=Actinoallomurus acaciae TaxID=502577 RepID=A0ABV5YWZ4_9ACTN